MTLARETLNRLSGQALLTAYPSSPGVTRKFCSRCGSNIEWCGSQAFPDWVSIPVAVLDSDFAPRPIRDIHLESRACWLIRESG